MSLHVLLEVTLDSEALVTNFAGEGFLLGVTPLMLTDLSGESEGLGTILTLELLLHPGVFSLMAGGQVSGQIPCRLESLRTELTLELPLARVTRQVIVSDGFVGKHLRAEITLEVKFHIAQVFVNRNLVFPTGFLVGKLLLTVRTPGGVLLQLVKHVHCGDKVILLFLIIFRRFLWHLIILRVNILYVVLRCRGALYCPMMSFHVEIKFSLDNKMLVTQFAVINFQAKFWMRFSGEISTFLYFMNYRSSDGREFLQA